MPSWRELLDDYEASITALEAVIDAGDEPPTGDWEPPTELPAAPATTDERGRFASLQARAEACADRGHSWLAGAERDLGNLRRTGAAARAYGEWGG